ncbi:MAG: single-stranded DNA-binding protein, partial [Chloroflexi bacterium]|nr:single-stranded DNA-binding protein [Chloroflexota bacterium]
PEMRYTANGQAVTTFNLAVNRNWTSRDGERREDTEWVTVVCWEKLAETVSQYLQKGRQAFVEGRLQTRNWEGQDGVKRYKTEVVATTVQFLDRVEAASNVDEGTPQPSQEEAPAPVEQN